jgi:hypothetical protein
MSDHEADQRRDLDYQFTIDAGHVTAMQQVVGGQAYDLPLPDKATSSFGVGTNTVTETLLKPNSATVIVYVQEAGSTTLYDKADVTTTFTDPSTAHGGYAFAFDSSGAVTAEQRAEVEHGHTHAETVHLPLDAVFSVSSGAVTEQYAKGNEIDTISFAQPSGSTLYAVQYVEKTYIDAGAATTSLDVDADDRMTFSFDSSGAVTQAQRIDPHGGAHTVAGSHVAFIQLGADNSYVEKVTTHGSHSEYAVYYAGQSTNGVYTEIAHGAGSTVDLAGLQAQVHAAEQVLFTGATAAGPTGWII